MPPLVRVWGRLNTARQVRTGSPTVPPSTASRGRPPGGGDKAGATTGRMGRRNSPALGDDKPTAVTQQQIGTEGLLCAGTRLSTVRGGFLFLVLTFGPYKCPTSLALLLQVVPYP